MPKERLLNEIYLKYNSYFPTPKIKSLNDLLKYAKIDRSELRLQKCLDEDKVKIPNLKHGFEKLFPPKIVKDLPSGGQRLLQMAEGYRATIVSGKIVVENDRLTNQRPGRLIRMGKK